MYSTPHYFYQGKYTGWVGLSGVSTQVSDGPLLPFIQALLPRALPALRKGLLVLGHILNNLSVSKGTLTLSLYGQAEQIYVVTQSPRGLVPYIKGKQIMAHRPNLSCSLFL